MVKLYGVICADVVDSTSLSIKAMIDLRKVLDDVFFDVERYLGIDFWGRIVKGDTIECCVFAPGMALRVAMLLKCRLKWWADTNGYGDEKFRSIGLRFSIGIGPMRILDIQRDIMDGEAIYAAGRGLDIISQRDLTSSFGFVAADLGINDLIGNNICFIDEHINNMSARQCAVVYYKLLDLLERDICKFLNLSQPAVNLRAKGASWNLLQRTLHVIERWD